MNVIYEEVTRRWIIHLGYLIFLNPYPYHTTPHAQGNQKYLPSSKSTSDFNYLFNGLTIVNFLDGPHIHRNASNQLVVTERKTEQREIGDRCVARDAKFILV